MTLVDIASVIEGQRFRHDLGDIKSLAESMTDVGLLHPIVVTPDLQLVAGGRRLAAARSLGWCEIDATIVENLGTADSVLTAESDENSCRKDFLPTEASNLKRAREKLLPSTQGARTDIATSVQVRQKLPRIGDVAARGLGYSRATLAKVEKVQTIATSPETPEPVREVAKAALEDMDRTGKVDRPYQAVSQAVEAAEPVNQVVDANERLADLNFQAAFSRDLSRAHKAVLTYSAGEVAARVEQEQIASLEELARSFTAFAADVRGQTKTLRVVTGGKS